MSKRKINELHGEDESGGGRGIVSVAESAVVSLQSAGGWGDLPPELIRRVAKLQKDARSLAGMERTCKLWRNIVMEGDGALKTADNDGNSCLWRNLVLAEHPSLESIAEIMTDDNNDGSGPTKFSWKGLLRSHRGASKTAEKKSPPVYQPRTQLSDYIFTMEFYSGEKLLFTTSGRGGVKTPQLWDQEMNGWEERLADAQTNLWYHISCPRGDLDPEFAKRLGSDGPLDDTMLDKMSVRVVVTRTSDMSMVELVHRLPVPGDELAADWDAGHYIYFGDVQVAEHDLPTGRMVVDDENVVGMQNMCTVVSYHSLELHITLETQTGKVSLEFRQRDHGSWEETVLSSRDILMYLEVQCPWPEDC